MSRPSWLYQAGDYYAHAYPEDDSITTAFCGNRLRDYCESCGRDDDVTDGGKFSKCKACLAALDGAKR